MPDPDENKLPSELRRLVRVISFFLILGLLAWGKAFLLPLILAGLFSLVLSPAVAWLERHGFRPVLAVLSVVVVAFLLLGSLCAVVSSQALDLVNTVPKYRSNIVARWESLRQGPPGPLNTATRNLHALIDDLSRVSTSAVDVGQAQRPTKVEVVANSSNLLAVAQSSLTPLVGPATEFAVVVLLVVFLLLERHRLRPRFLRLVGHSHSATTTLAVDEAGARLSGFLLAQLQVNAGFALAVGIGLYFLGIPNAVLWAVLTLTLRFLPYVGIWIAAAFPLVLSIATSTGWTTPLLTLGLYVFLEVFTNNVVEPIVLGGSTGISPLAVIAAALFWTWLWGPVGLVLATPLTACLVVLGRYFPAFHFCSVLLAADPPTAMEVKLTRLLTENRLPEAKALVNEAIGAQLNLTSAEELVMPTVRAIENELFPGAASNPTKARIYQQLREVLEGLSRSSTASEETAVGDTVAGDRVIAIVPSVGEGDEIAGQALVDLLQQEGLRAHVIPSKLLRAEKLEQLKELQATVIVLSCVAARSAATLDKMARTLQTALPGATIFVGLWSLPPQGAARLVRRLREARVGGVYTNLEQAIRGLVALQPPPPEHPDEVTKLADEDADRAVSDVGKTA